jgi:hypothetical protein
LGKLNFKSLLFHFVLPNAEIVSKNFCRISKLKGRNSGPYSKVAAAAGDMGHRVTPSSCNKCKKRQNEGVKFKILLFP